MGRKSKLTEGQWNQIKTKIIAGATLASISREYDISVPVLSKRFAGYDPDLIVKNTAEKMLEGEKAFNKLDIVEQIAVKSYLDELRATSENLISAAYKSSETTKKLADTAHQLAQTIDPRQGFEKNADKLRHTMAFQNSATSASELPMKLLTANKEVASRSMEEKQVVEYKPVTAIEAAKAYQKLMGGG